MDYKAEEIVPILMKNKNFDNTRDKKKYSLNSSFSFFGQAIISGCDKPKTPKHDIRPYPQSACGDIGNYISQEQKKTSVQSCTYKQCTAPLRNSVRIPVKQKDLDISEAFQYDNKLDSSSQNKIPSRNQPPNANLNTNSSSNVVSDNDGQIYHFTTNLQNNVTIINNICPNAKSSNETTPEISTIDQGGRGKKRKKSNFKQSKFEGELVKKKVEFSHTKLDENMYKCDIPFDITDKRNSGAVEKFQHTTLSNLKEQPIDDMGPEKKNLKKFKTEAILQETDISQYYKNQKEIERKSSDVGKAKKVVYVKKIGCISGFSGDTFRNYKKINEDKLSISINYKLTKDQKIKSDTIPKVHFFAIYDGHGGETVATLLQNHLYKQIFSEVDLFLGNPEQAILNGFSVVEQMVKDMNDPEKNSLSTIDNSGSCAIIVINFDNRIYVVNLGDSRAMISLQTGLRIHALSLDHKPLLEGEKKRILDAGGKIVPVECHSPQGKIISRVHPGGLAVSRSIGDLNAKIPKFGGIEGIISAEPEILSFDFNEDIDFIVIGSDGLFDMLTNKDIALVVLKTVKESITCNESYGNMLEKIPFNLMTNAQAKESKDNISCIFLCLLNLYNIFFEKDLKKLKKSISQLKESTMEFENLFIDETTKRYPQLKSALTRKSKSSCLRPEAIDINPHQSSVIHLTPTIKHSQNKSQIGEMPIKKEKKEKKRGFSCCGLFN